MFEKKSSWNFINAKVLNTIITIIAPKWAAEEPRINGFWSWEYSPHSNSDTTGKESSKHEIQKPCPHPRPSPPQETYLSFWLYIPLAVDVISV